MKKWLTGQRQLRPWLKLQCNIRRLSMWVLLSAYKQNGSMFMVWYRTLLHSSSLWKFVFGHISTLHSLKSGPMRLMETIGSCSRVL